VGFFNTNVDRFLVYLNCFSNILRLCISTHQFRMTPTVVLNGNIFYLYSQSMIDSIKIVFMVHMVITMLQLVWI